MVRFVERDRRVRRWWDAALQEYMAAVLEVLEPRVLLSGMGVQVLGELRGNSLIPGAASVPVADSQGNVYVWAGDSIFEQVRATGEVKVVADLESMNEPVLGNWNGWGRLY